MLPSGLIFGKLLNREAMAKEIKKHVDPKSEIAPIEQAVKSISYRFTYKDMDDADPDAAEEEIITLFHACLYGQDCIVDAPLVHVCANKIIAWGPGPRPSLP